MHDVVPIEYYQQTFHRSHRVMRPRFDKLSQAAPTVLNGANEYEDVLVGTFHKCTWTRQIFRTGEPVTGRVIRDAVIPIRLFGWGSYPFERR
jgi:hypothetical protein